MYQTAKPKTEPGPVEKAGFGLCIFAINTVDAVSVSEERKNVHSKKHGHYKSNSINENVQLEH